MEHIDVEGDEDSDFILTDKSDQIDVPSAATNKSTNSKEPAEKSKLIRLPLSRVKGIMKMDPDCQLISQDALVLVTKATEFFLENLAKETVKYTLNGKRKIILKRDLFTAIDVAPNLCFLDGTLDSI